MSTPTETSVIEGVHPQLFIGGSWRDAEDKSTFAVDDPSTGKTLVEVADATVADGAAALDAAVAAQADWAATPPRDRGEILRKAFDSISERADEVALLMTMEMGKTIKESKAEITYGAEFFRWFSEEAVRIAGRYSTAPNGATRLLTLKQPVGPCLMITPWNFPLAMGTRKVGPAIAAGCTMVVKPAGLTPLTMLWLAQVLADAGLPDGVLNVVTTTHTGEVMEPLIRDPRLRKLTFTGSTERRPHPRRAERGGVAPRLDGAGRQRTVPRVRRCRPGRCRRRRDARQDAQHRRGLHRGQPVHRARVRGPGVRREARRPHG